MSILPSTQVDWVRLYKDEHSRFMVKDAYEATEKAEAWDYLKRFEPDQGFMFSSDATVNKINANMKYDGHSGGSYGWTMRQIQYIAQNGIKYD
jgi:hypothetical protein